MIVNIQNELRDFTYITNLYKCIANYNLMGHQIGRKVEGFTSAGHKVEFGFFENPLLKDGLFGAIECKCVGVEETKFTSGHIKNLDLNSFFDISMSGQWMTNSITATIKLISIVNNTGLLEISNSKDNRTQQIQVSVGDLWNCLTGPQTIEKAKQASLVAMDLRKKIDGHWGKEDVDQNNKLMTFIHVLCEFSHWEEKSRNVIKTCIDHNLVVPDEILIYAFKRFEDHFGTDNMLEKYCILLTIFIFRIICSKAICISSHSIAC